MDPFFNEVCFSCNKRLGERLWEKYQTLLKEGLNFESALNQMRIIRGCCRRMFYSYVPIKEYPDNPNICRTSLFDDEKALSVDQDDSDQDDGSGQEGKKGREKRVKFESGGIEELGVLEAKIAKIRKKTKRWLSEIGENYKKVPSKEEMLSLEKKGVLAYLEDSKKFVEITYPEALSLQSHGQTIFYKRGLVYELEKTLARLFPEEPEVDPDERTRLLTEKDASLLEEEPLEEAPESLRSESHSCEGCEGLGISEEEQAEIRLEKEVPKEKFYVCKGCGLRYGSLGCDCVGILLLKTGSAERETGEYWCLTCGDDEKVKDLKMTCNSCGTKKKFPKVMEDLNSGDLNKSFLSSKNLNYVCRECIDFGD